MIQFKYCYKMMKKINSLLSICLTTTMMNTWARIFVSLVITTICIDLPIAQGDPTAVITYTKVETQVFDNPYIGEWTSVIHPSGGKISFIAPVKKDFPPTMMVRGSFDYMGNQVGEIDMPFCETFEEKIFAKSVLDAGLPKGKFPQSCPVKSNGDYVISEYIFPIDIIPPGLPDGLAVGHAEFYEPGKDPYVIIRVDGKLSHKIPGLGR